jgi:hypothetical protein
MGILFHRRSAVVVVFCALFFSCVSAPRTATRTNRAKAPAASRAVNASAAPVRKPEQNTQAGAPALDSPAAAPSGNSGSVPVLPPVPAIPEYILGTGRINAEQLAAFLLTNNPTVDPRFARAFAAMYIEEGGAEGVNSDIAFAQMCVETGFLRFGGLVTPEMNNFAGIGAIGNEQRGEYFPSPAVGVLAQIQHLKAYATDERPRKPLVDPRYRYVRYGSATTVAGLAGTWAADKRYAEKIRAMLERLYKESYQ